MLPQFLAHKSKHVSLIHESSCMNMVIAFETIVPISSRYLFLFRFFLHFGYKITHCSDCDEEKVTTKREKEREREDRVRIPHEND